MPQPGSTGGEQAPASEVRGVAAAALPFSIVDGHTGRAVGEPEFWTAIESAKAVCAGEEHPNPHHHWAQLAIVEHLAKAAPPAGGARRYALGLEMVTLPFQGPLTDYQGQVIDEATFLSRVDWKNRWGFDFGLYRPMLERARAAGWTLLALNAPRELVKRVGKVGVAGLDGDERAQLPELVLDDARHRAWFDGVMGAMGGHGDGGPNMDHIYAAQVTWDETMAHHAAKWVDGGGHVVILAGNGHCHDSAIVGRMQRRGVARVLSVRPIIDDGEGNVAAALAEKMNDFLFVMTMPK